VTFGLRSMRQEGTGLGPVPTRRTGHPDHAVRPVGLVIRQRR
jgi:hypothetical protein